VRFAQILFLLLPGALWGAQNWLLVDDAGIRAAAEKAQRYPWARAAMNSLVAEAEAALSNPVAVPAKVAQWPHWYSCKRDGARLVTDSPTAHRCPVCGAVYHGDPYDAVVVGRTHNRLSTDVRALGLAYRLTNRAEFARRAREILTGYADRYASYPRHDVNGADNVRGGRIMAQTLDESTWLIPVAWGYSLVRDTFDDAARRHVEDDLLKAAARAIREHRMAIHNIQCWKNSAVGLAGFATGDKELVQAAIDDPESGFRAQIAKGVTAEGLWWEGSLGYHAYTMQALWPLAEAARIAGINLYDDTYRRLFDAPLALALPDGNPPGFNDSPGGALSGYASLYELAFSRWNRPEYAAVAALGGRESFSALLWGADDLPPGDPVPHASTLLKASGFAVLREGAEAVAARFGTHGGGHGHPDKLGIVTYGAGREFGLDPGSINYGVPLHTAWYRTTIAHNTVAVDGKSQANADGLIEKWDAGNGRATLVASADNAYPGVALRRTLALESGRLRDRFECSSASEHTYDWAFHSAGRLTTSLQMKPRAGTLADVNGYQHIRNLAEASTDSEWWARWEQDGAVLTLRMNAAPGTTVFTGAAPGRDPATQVPMIVVRRRAASTTFEAGHEFTRKPLRVSVYATASAVSKFFGDAQSRQAALPKLQALGITHVFLEGRRADEYVPPAVLAEARDWFRVRGFEVTGGIATVPGSQFGTKQDDVLTWLNWESEKTRRDIAAFFRENAAIFDEIVVDDFYCTGDTSPASDTARKGRPWSDYRRDLMVSLMPSLIFEPAREVRPDIRLILKFPQWYDRFHMFGYDPERMPGPFDRIWVGTEVRNPKTRRMGYVQPTEGFINFRWLRSAAGPKTEGAWFDHIESTAENVIDQAYQSVLAGARELTLFSLYDVMGGHPSHPLLGAALGDLRSLADKVAAAPARGVACYKPTASEAHDNLYLMDFTAMLGIPVLPEAHYPETARVAILPAQAATDPMLLTKIRKHLARGATLVMTPALLRLLGPGGAALAGVTVAAQAQPALGDGRVEIDAGLSATASETVIAVEAGGRRVPLLTRKPAGSGAVLVWNVRTFTEDDFRATGERLLAPKPLGISEMPQALLEPLRRAMLAPLNVNLSAPAGVGFYLFGDSACLYSFLDQPAKAEFSGRSLTLPPHRPLWLEGAARVRK
jgi:oligo-alginate lyase